MSMSFNGNLVIESFLLQEWTNQIWKSPTWLNHDHKYRFAVKVRNNALAAGALNLSLTVFNMLIPGFPYMLPRGKVIIFGRVKVSISGQPTALNAYQFYGNSDYTGICTPVGNAEAPEPLGDGDYATLFVHFIWKAAAVNLSLAACVFAARSHQCEGVEGERIAGWASRKLAAEHLNADVRPLHGGFTIGRQQYADSTGPATEGGVQGRQRGARVTRRAAPAGSQ